MHWSYKNICIITWCDLLTTYPCEFWDFHSNVIEVLVFCIVMLHCWVRRADHFKGMFFLDLQGFKVHLPHLPVGSPRLTSTGQTFPIFPCFSVLTGILHKPWFPEDEGNTFLQNVGSHLPSNGVSCSRSPESFQIMHHLCKLCTVNCRAYSWFNVAVSVFGDSSLT